MERTVVSIDVGSTKICALVGEVGTDLNLRIVGVGVVPARGLRKGVVVNVGEATKAIAAAVAEAERSSGYHIERAYVSVNGKHIASHNSQGVVAVSRREEGIVLEDVDRVLDAASAVSLAHNRELIHVIPRHYVVDGQEGVRDPLGMHGFRLEAEAHVATGSASAMQNLVKCVTGAGVEVDEIALASLASAHAVLADNEREMGVVLVDIGGGTTNIAIFIDGTVWHTVTLGVGGEYITNDVAIGLRLPTETAEAVKVEYGHARSVQVGHEERFTVETFGDGGPLSVPRWKLAEIIEARAEEIIIMVGQEIKRSGYDGLLPAGVVLCGGVAELPGIRDLAREVLELPVRVGRPQGLIGLVDRISGPAYATAVGLMGWGLTADERRPLPKVGVSFGQRFLRWLRAFLPGQTGE
jgi:cell division protein FtsA